MSRVGKKYIPDLAGFPFSDQPLVGKILQRNLEMISSTLASGSGSQAMAESSRWLPPATPSFSQNVDWLVFSGTAPATPLAGYLWYDTAEQTLAFKNDISNTTMNVGAENWIRGVNKTGSVLADGKVVYVSGAQGNRPTVTLSDNTVEDSVDNLIGLVTAPIGINAEGNVTVFGVVNGYDTSTFTAGDPLYLSTSGGLTNTMPSATGTDLIQHVGYALNSTNNGKVLVAPRGPSHMAHLHDVLDGTPTAGYVLQGDGNRWTKFDLFGTANTWRATQTLVLPDGNAALDIYSVGTSAANIRTFRSTGTVGAYTPVLVGQGTGLAEGYFNTNTGVSPNWVLTAGVYCIAAENHSPTTKGTSVQIYATTNGDNATALAMTIQPTVVTLPQTSVTWSGNPTHSGNHIWSGTATFNGNVTLGNATTDTITLSSRFASALLPSTNNARTLGTDALRWSGVYATEFYRAGVALGTTLATYLPLAGGTITGNLVVGDAVGDTLTVNATPIFNAPVKITNTAFPALTVERVADGTSGVRTGAYMTRKSSSAFASVSNAFGCGQVYGANLAGTDYYFGYIAGRKLGTAGEIVLVVYDDSTSVSVTSNVGIFSKTEATLPQLAGTGTRITTSSSTGLFGSRLASSYITQTLTANAAIALDTELLRMTGTGFTGTLTTSLGDYRVISFRNSGTGNMTIACAGAETIDGVATLVIPVGGIAKICSVGSGVWETVL